MFLDLSVCEKSVPLAKLAVILRSAENGKALENFSNDDQDGSENVTIKKKFAFSQTSSQIIPTRF